MRSLTTTTACGDSRALTPPPAGPGSPGTGCPAETSKTAPRGDKSAFRWRRGFHRWGARCGRGAHAGRTRVRSPVLGPRGAGRRRPDPAAGNAPQRLEDAGTCTACWAASHTAEGGSPDTCRRMDRHTHVGRACNGTLFGFRKEGRLTHATLWANLGAFSAVK